MFILFTLLIQFTLFNTRAGTGSKNTVTSFYLSLVEDKNYGPFSVSRSLRRKYVSTNLIFVTFLKLCDPALALLFTTVYRVSTIQTALHCLHSSMHAIAIIYC